MSTKEEEDYSTTDGTVVIMGIKPIPDVYSDPEEIQLTQYPDVESSDDNNDDRNNDQATLIADDPVADSTITESPKRKGSELKKTLTLFNTVTMIIGNIIGSGIFITPTTVLMFSGSFGMSLIFWVIGGIIAICGGLVYVELSTLIKDSGAEYAFLREAYSFGSKKPILKTIGHTIAFSSLWSAAFLVRPLSASIIAKAFALYLCQAIAGGTVPSNLPVELVASATIIILAVINMLSVRLTAILINVLSVVKVLSMIFIMGIGLYELIIGNHLDNFRNAFEGTSPCIGDLVLAFYSVSFTYSGWSSVAYLVEESKNAEKNLPRGLFIAIPIVSLCYILVNMAYYAGLSKTELLSSPATALTLGHSVMGKAGLIVIPLLVASSTFGSALFGTFAGPRVTLSGARDGNLPEVLGLLQNTSKTPVPATFLHMVIALVFVFGGDISQLINGEGVVEFISYTLVFISVIILRFTMKNTKRPFKVWIVLPIVLAVISAFLVVTPLILVPSERLISLIMILLLLSALPVYLIFGWEKIRPKFLNTLCEKATEIVSLVLDSSSTRSSK